MVTEEEIKDVSLFATEEGQEEHLSQEELELPFLRVAQKGSPQVDEDKPEYIEGLKPGDYFNTVSGLNYGSTLKIQVHGYFRSYVIWKGEKGSGDFNGTMTPDEFQTFEKENTLHRDGGDMVHVVDGETLRYSDTRNFIVSLPEFMDDGIMIYPMASTASKAARKWNTLNSGRRINGRAAKRYATLWEIKTSGFEAKGYTWKQTAQIKPLGWVSQELAEYGRSFEDFVQSIKDRGVNYGGNAEAQEEAESSEF